MSSAQPIADPVDLTRAIEIAIRLSLIAILVAWCFGIMRPFIIPVVWAIIIATAVNPAFCWVEAKLGGRTRSAAALFVVLGLDFGNQFCGTCIEVESRPLGVVEDHSIHRKRDSFVVRIVVIIVGLDKSGFEHCITRANDAAYRVPGLDAWCSWLHRYAVQSLHIAGTVVRGDDELT